MCFIDVIRAVRILTDGFDCSCSRSDFVEANKSELDLDAESILSEFSDLVSSEPFRLSSVDAIRRAVLLVRGGELLFQGVSSADFRKPYRGLYSYFDDEQDNPTIVYNKDLNLCWRRFVVLKEIMHYYIGIVEDDLRDTNLAYAILHNAVSSRRLVCGMDSDISDEAAAFYMTLEAALPHRLRPQLLSLRDRGATSYQIAKVFMIPQVFVEHFFVDDRVGATSYAGLSYRVNGDVTREREEKARMELTSPSNCAIRSVSTGGSPDETESEVARAVLSMERDLARNTEIGVAESVDF